MKNGNIIGIDNIHMFNEDGARIDNIFNFGYNEEEDHAYCDLFDHGIYRVYRDEGKEIIKIQMIRDGKMITLVQEKKDDN